MIDSKINAIIFDFGGVLININYEATIDAFKNMGIENFKKMYSQIEQSKLFDAIEVGKISEEEFIDAILQFLPKRITEKQVIEAWNAMILNVPESSIKLLHRLKSEGYKIFMLSNTNKIHIKQALMEWNKVTPLSPYDIFDHVYLSHEIKMRKPNLEIFEYVCHQQAIDPSTTLFIDDSIQHIEGAREFGLNTHHLISGQSLESIFS